MQRTPSEHGRRFGSEVGHDDILQKVVGPENGGDLGNAAIYRVVTAAHRVGAATCSVVAAIYRV